MILKGKQPYLSNIGDFKQSRLKLLARLNCLPLNSTLSRMKLTETDKCQLCDLNTSETILHVLLECSAYQRTREKNFILYSRKSIFHCKRMLLGVVALESIAVFNRRPCVSLRS